MILSLLSQDFGRKLIVRASCLAPWDNAKKYISAGDLEPDHDKGSDTHQKTVTGDTVGDPLKGHFWPCFYYSMKLTAILSVVFGSVIVAHRISREVHFE